MGSELTFQDRTVVPFDNGDGKIWFTTDALADLLGYANANKVSNIYNRHKDEFTDSMTTVTKVRKDGINNSLREVEMRIFFSQRCAPYRHGLPYQGRQRPAYLDARPGRKRIWHSDCPIECLRTCQTYRSADSRSESLHSTSCLSNIADKKAADCSPSVRKTKNALRKRLSSRFS